MTQASELYAQFKSRQLDYFEFQKKLFHIYRYGVRTPKFIEEVFDIIEDSLRNNTNTDNLMWANFFVSDRDMYKRINLLNTRLLAESSLNDYLPETQAKEVLLKMIAGTAYSSCSRDNDDTRIINLDVKNVWLDVFKNVPEFIPALDKQLAYWRDWHISTREQYADYYAGIEAHRNKPIVAEYVLEVPIKFMDGFKPYDSSDIQMDSNTYRLINEILTDFNEFGIEGYIDGFGKKCVKSSVDFAGNLIFKFECCEFLSLDELKRIPKEFCGQLSDGWGEHVSQRQILIDDKLISIDFDIERVSDFKINNINVDLTNNIGIH